MNEGLLSPEQIKKLKTLRGIYSESRKQNLSEERRIWKEQILPQLKEDEEKYVMMEEVVFNEITRVSEKYYTENK